jgi:hypothetical protein
VKTYSLVIVSTKKPIDTTATAVSDPSTLSTSTDVIKDEVLIDFLRKVHFNNTFISSLLCALIICLNARDHHQDIHEGIIPGI